MSFRTLAYIAISILGILTAALVICSTRLERQTKNWEWLHPPDDDDGCNVLEDKNHENH